MGEWQPVETAPKDGTAFIGFLPAKSGYTADQRYVVLHYIGWGGGVWTDGGMAKYQLDEVSHWMPLPRPPEGQDPYGHRGKGGVWIPQLGPCVCRVCDQERRMGKILTERAAQSLDSHDLLEEADKLRAIAKECGCSECQGSGAVIGEQKRYDQGTSNERQEGVME